MIELEHVVKRYGDIVALNDVELRVRPGQICALLGPNGAGKTTLVSIVAGLRRIDSGTVRVTGPVGLAPQEIGIYPTLSVRENLQFAGELHGVSRRVLYERIGLTAAAVGLTNLLGRLAGQLSGGEQRRLHTAMALLHRPKVVLLDEPTAGSDVETRQRLLGLVRQLADDGSAVCYSTHYLAEVQELDANVAILNRGSLVMTGTVADILQRHGQGFVSMILDDGQTIRHPNVDVTAALRNLGTRVEHLRSVDVVNPSLEAAYVAMVGEHPLEPA